MPHLANQPLFPDSLQLGQLAPDFVAHSTLGVVSRAGFAGRWLVFFSHPADFTPVCATEFVALAKRQADFRSLNCALLGLSSDSVPTHAAWCQQLRKDCGVAIDFPIVADERLDVARLYGMVSAPAARRVDVRALFIIDPRGVLRAMFHYPSETGRSVAEVLRTVQALQEADRKSSATPEGWQPGDPMLAVPDVDHEAPPADAGLGCVEWYEYPESPPSDPEERATPSPRLSPTAAQCAATAGR